MASLSGNARLRYAFWLILLCFAGSVFLFPMVVPKDIQERYFSTISSPILEWIATTKAKDPESQHELGNRYRVGLGVQINKKLACDWYEKAAEAGFPKSLNALGYCYHYGMGREKDIARSIELYEKAAHLGNRLAKENLSNLYYQSYDYENAAIWFEILAEEGNSGAQAMIGYFYMNGQGVPRDFEKAKYWLNLAAEHGSAESLVNLGILYRSEGKIEKSALAYMKALQLSGELAYTPITYAYLGFSSINKHYVFEGLLLRTLINADDDRHIKLLQNFTKYCENQFTNTSQRVNSCFLAAGAGFSEASSILSSLYHTGTGVPKDDIDALAWALVASNKVPEFLMDPLDRNAIEEAHRRSQVYKKSIYLATY